MTSLVEIQRLFAEALLDERAHRGIGVHLYDNNNDLAETLRKCRQKMISKRICALASTYPVCLRLVGKHYFRQIGRYYAERHHASIPHLTLYGEAFPAFLDNVIRIRSEARELPHLPDIARLEWAWRECVFAPPYDPNITSLTTVGSRAHTGVAFELPPSARLLYSDFPVHTIWQTLRFGGHPKDQAQGPQRIFIWAEEEKPRTAAVDPETWHILLAIRNGATLAELSNMHNYCSDIPQRLAAMVERGWITNFYERAHRRFRRGTSDAA